MNKTVCFAYYIDGNFIGWYGDSFGRISNIPKVFYDINKTREIILKNFSLRINRIKDVINNNDSVSQIMSPTVDEDKILSSGEVELRVVNCPVYEGPNESFDNEKYKQELFEYERKMKETISFSEEPSMERLNSIRRFKIENPPPILNNWIFADRNKLEEWAKIEPSEFLEKIKPTL